MSYPKRLELSAEEVISYLEDMKGIFCANNYKWTSLCRGIEAIRKLELIENSYIAEDISEGSTDY